MLFIISLTLFYGLLRSDVEEEREVWAGRDTSGALDHLYVKGLDTEEEDFRGSAFDVENAILENAYPSQSIVVPGSSRNLIFELQTYGVKKRQVR